ncbi:hypothetical protein E2986_03552 [Frieseomelitta varia]|uniref:Gustatory receptor n=1 Tax=Frieseomelitta varia TaxID=561572 RepID=A0A833S6T7_9HYME|nr:hypothetical protein E2986_03552 [Frieseomelitta varia]
MSEELKYILAERFTFYIYGKMSPKSSSQFGKLDNLKTEMDTIGMSEPVTSSVSAFDPNADSLHASMRPIIMLAQCFSLFPVSGVNSPDASYLRFTWRSPKFIYCVISIVGSSMMTVFNILRIVTNEINSTKMTTLVFNGTNLIATFLFLRLAVQWPCLMVTWEKLEKELSYRHRKISKTSLAAKFKIVTTVVMMFALVEHSLSIAQGYIKAKECATFQEDPNIFGVYFQMQFPQIFSRISYSLWKGILVDLINILSTFSWNFVDLFLILISIALTAQFRQLNSRLNSIRGKAMPEWWWAEARSDYNHLATLTRQLDSRISIMVMRFLAQVTTDNICLTGMKFFSVTRSLVLTVAGTIVTYELVLVQFNATQQNNSSNSTIFCEVK